MQKSFLPGAGRQGMLKARWLVDHNMKKLSMQGNLKIFFVSQQQVNVSCTKEY